MNKTWVGIYFLSGAERIKLSLLSLDISSLDPKFTDLILSPTCLQAKPLQKTKLGFYIQHLIPLPIQPTQHPKNTQTRFHVKKYLIYLHYALFKLSVSDFINYGSWTSRGIQMESATRKYSQGSVEMPLVCWFLKLHCKICSWCY